MRTRSIQNKYLVSAFITIYSILGIFCLGISIAGDRGLVPNEVVKQILQHPKLTEFLHPEIEGRVPVVIQSHFVDPKINLILYGKPLVVVSDSKKHLTTNIYMSFFEDGKVSITYPVEGIKGIFKFVLDETGKWKLDTANVWEN